MGESLVSNRLVEPRRASVHRFVVAGRRQVSPGFVRVTVAPTDAEFGDEFTDLGFDQWVRLFLPNQDGLVEPPFGDAEGWYARWKAADPQRRPVIRNYTIREARRSVTGWELDLDFVLHRSDTGRLEGTAARWASSAQPGDPVGLLDQGRIFDVADDDRPILIISDESGLPGVEGIARSLAGRPATYLIEVPDPEDRRDLADAVPAWLVRDPHQRPGHHLLRRLASTVIDPEAYVYIVGEAGFMVQARDFARAAGIPKQRMDFCAYWRAGLSAG
jgi:NADPH-dependent ferric siderophore reductase